MVTLMIMRGSAWLDDLRSKGETKALMLKNLN